MGLLHLVRHGQASFGADDYDQLSPLGERQCARLGAYLAERGARYDAVYIGTLKRHRQSLDAIASALPELPSATVLPGLDEYDSHAVIRAVHAGPLPPVRTPEEAKQHFRLLRDGLLRWMAGEVQPEGMPSHRDFLAGITNALDQARAQAEGRVLIVSSGGPISTAVGHVLGVPPETVVELNMRIRNSALTELLATPKRHSLISFNSVAHLDHPDYAGWLTHA